MMSDIIFRTKNGNKDITVERLRALLDSGKVRETMRCVSDDGGKSWVTIAEVLSHYNDVRNEVQKREDMMPVEKADTIDIPERIKELLHNDENVLYASRPSKNALRISMIVNGIIYGSIGLSLYFVGVIFVLPIALFVTYHSWKNKYYVITDSRTIVSQGISNIAIKIVSNKNIQVISINTGIIDRWLQLNSVELSTAGGGSEVLAFFPGMAKSTVALKHVVVKDVIKHYYQ